MKDEKEKKKDKTFFSGFISRYGYFGISVITMITIIILMTHNRNSVREEMRALEDGINPPQSLTDAVTAFVLCANEVMRHFFRKLFTNI